MSNGYDIWGIIAGALGLLGLLPILVTIVENQLPSAKFKALHETIIETESLFRTVMEEGLLKNSAYVAQTEGQLRWMRSEVEDLRAKIHYATTFRKEMQAFFKGLSRRISMLCKEVKELRADISATSSEERRRLLDLRSCAFPPSLPISSHQDSNEPPAHSTLTSLADSPGCDSSIRSQVHYSSDAALTDETHATSSIYCPTNRRTTSYHTQTMPGALVDSGPDCASLSALMTPLRSDAMGLKCLSAVSLMPDAVDQLPTSCNNDYAAGFSEDTFLRAAHRSTEITDSPHCGISDVLRRLRSSRACLRSVHAHSFRTSLSASCLLRRARLSTLSSCRRSALSKGLIRERCISGRGSHRLLATLIHANRVMHRKRNVVLRSNPVILSKFFTDGGEWEDIDD